MTSVETLLEQVAVVQIDDKEVAGYAIYRSPTQAKFVNIVAINHAFEPMFVRYADLTIDEAAVMMDMIEQEQLQKGKQ
jgi:hypothetical protein